MFDQIKHLGYARKEAYKCSLGLSHRTYWCVWDPIPAQCEVLGVPGPPCPSGEAAKSETICYQRRLQSPIERMVDYPIENWKQ